MSSSHVLFISAGAGSGKTYRLTQELNAALVGGVNPARVIGTTFTVKAAAELRERVRENLIADGRIELAEATAQALIGTVHSVSERLLKRFAFELGLSPELSVASVEDCGQFFNHALDDVLAADTATVRDMNGIAERLGIEDWRADVKALADRARDNDIAAAALAGMGRRAADDLLAHFAKPEPGDWDDAFLAAVRRTLDDIDLEYDTTSGTKAYYDWLKAAAWQLRRPPAPWPVWISASKKSATRKSDDSAARVRAAAAQYERHPGFHADVRRHIERTYTLAGLGLERFQQIKTERGLIDFTDMEQRLLAALDEPIVRERIAADLELLLVDEFQDTNPMQLAIFMKLAALADRVIFVGDVKQAIYGFRGCDPELVRDTLAALIERGAATEVLERSWRSRPALVEYINHVFVQSFDGELETRQVVLQAVRPEVVEDPAVIGWTIAGNKAARADVIASGIARLVHDGYRIADPDSGEPRPLRWGDIAVLAASNEHVEAIARALRAAHVPMKMTLSGLLTVPEVRLARAALRRLADAADTLASAEIVAMTAGDAPEAWLADRLTWLAAGGESYAWGERDHPILSALAAMRATIGTQSPVEIVARVLNHAGLREAVTAFSANPIKAAQRQKNLDALLQLAVEYERHCAAQHLAATLTGLLLWLENPHSPDLDVQPVVTSGDAVHVLTYHRSKGLEWPVVVATDLDASWRSRLWDVRVERGAQPFDLERPLEGRVIRYWPNLFGRNTRDLPPLDSITACEEALACIDSGVRESRRLAYVGLTRARDALVLAVPARKPGGDAWLHTIRCPDLLPEGDTLTLANGTSIATRAETLEPGAGASPSTFSPRRLPERAANPARLPLRVRPSGMVPIEAAAVTERIDLGARVPIHGQDMNAIGNAIHDVIAAELVNPNRPDAGARMSALLDGLGVGAFVGAQDVLAAARRFVACIGERFAPERVCVEYPVVQRLPTGEVLSGAIDVVLETTRGCIVIDHKSSPRPRSEWTRDALEHSGQLAAYAAALEAAGKPVAETWIHFPVSGGLVRVEFQR